MLNTKDCRHFIAEFAGLAGRVVTLTIPEEINAVPAATLREAASREGLAAETAPSLPEAMVQAARGFPSPRIVICGSLYLAGRVLALHAGTAGAAG